MKRLIILFFRLLVFFIVRIYGYFAKIEINFPGYNFEKENKYILVSNHTSKLDPFLVVSFLPLKVFLRLSPIRFIIADEYLQKWYMRWFLYGCGCFSVCQKRNKGKKPLVKAQEFLDEGHTLFIFPEGRMIRDNQTNRNRPLGVGALYLVKQNINCYLIPAKISYSKNKQKKRKIKITYKQIIRPKSLPSDLQLPTKELMDYIYQ